MKLLALNVRLAIHFNANAIFLLLVLENLKKYHRMILLGTTPFTLLLLLYTTNYTVHASEIYNAILLNVVLESALTSFMSRQSYSAAISSPSE